MGIGVDSNPKCSATPFLRPADHSGVPASICSFKSYIPFLLRKLKAFRKKDVNICSGGIKGVRQTSIRAGVFNLGFTGLCRGLYVDIGVVIPLKEPCKILREWCTWPKKISFRGEVP